MTIAFIMIGVIFVVLFGIVICRLIDVISDRNNDVDS